MKTNKITINSYLNRKQVDFPQKHILYLSLLFIFAFTTNLYSQQHNEYPGDMLAPKLNINTQSIKNLNKNPYLFTKYDETAMRALLRGWVDTSCNVKLSNDNPWDGRIVPFAGDEELKLKEYVFRGLIIQPNGLKKLFQDGIKASDYNNNYFFASNIPWGGFFFALKPYFEFDIFYKHERPTKNYYSIAMQISTANFSKHYLRDNVFEDVPAKEIRFFIFETTKLCFEELSPSIFTKIEGLEINLIHQSI